MQKEHFLWIKFCYFSQVRTLKEIDIQIQGVKKRDCTSLFQFNKFYSSFIII